MNFARYWPRKAIQLFDNWRVWVMIAYAGLAVFGLVLWNNRNTTLSVVAQHRADIVANAEAQYSVCVHNIPVLRRSNRFIRGVQEVHAVLVENAVATHRVTPPGTLVYRAQIKNLERLRLALLDVKGLTFPTPTMAKCKALRARLKARP